MLWHGWTSKLFVLPQTWLNLTNAFLVNKFFRYSFTKSSLSTKRAHFTSSFHVCCPHQTSRMSFLWFDLLSTSAPTPWFCVLFCERTWRAPICWSPPSSRGSQFCNGLCPRLNTKSQPQKTDIFYDEILRSKSDIHAILNNENLLYRKRWIQLCHNV